MFEVELPSATRVTKKTSSRLCRRGTGRQASVTQTDWWHDDDDQVAAEEEEEADAKQQQQI